jgi:sn-glycerol 3-phosphate transport system substrate-binding protein
MIAIGVAALALGIARPAAAVTEIQLWHAMAGELGRQLDKLAADFNASQPDYRILTVYKGGYTETMTAAIFAVRGAPSRRSCR